MKTIQSPAHAVIEVNRSKFLAHLVPMPGFETLRERLKAEHPKANHIVWAFRRLDEYGHVVEDFSDDGEPKGCAGMPVLNVMRGNGLVECGLLVVRYFGGIKLGTGGMARAYGDAAKAVVAAAGLVPYEKRLKLRFEVPYARMGRWEYETQKLAGLTVTREFGGSGVAWCVEGGENAVETLAKLLEKSRIGFSIE
ncbi:IMPACT family protein [Hydrogenimonas sp.]